MVADAVAVPDTLPPASYAATPSVYDVPHVSPVNENDVDVDVPAALPFRNTRYPITPTLSLEAVQDSVIEVWPTALVASPVGVDGGVVSPQAPVEALIDVFELWLPAASKHRQPTCSWSRS